jgi:hypothetical protein
MKVARAVLAVALLLTLVAGSIALPAAARGPLCTLACCAGRVPHAAGSCMHGSCQAGVSTHNSASNNSHHTHHHDGAQASEVSAGSGVFSKVQASVGASEMGEVPTIEAAPYESSANAGEKPEAGANGSNGLALSGTRLAKPCEADCGACASGSPASKRSRSAATLAGSIHARSPSSLKLAAGKHPLTHIDLVLSRQSVPRGPPILFSC